MKEAKWNPAVVTAASEELESMKRPAGDTADESTATGSKQDSHLPARSKRVIVFGSDPSYLINFRGRLIATMISRDHKVVAVAPRISPAAAEEIRRLGAEPRELNLRNQSLDPVEMFRAYWQFRAIVRSWRPDVVIAYTIKPVVIGALAGAAEGVPNIVSLITGAGYSFSRGWELRRLASRIAATGLYRLALRRSDWVAFQNPDDERLFRDEHMIRPGQNTCLINGSGVDLIRFAQAPQPGGTPSFLMVSRLLKGKGVREFTVAAKCLKREYPESSVHLVGYRDASPDCISEADFEEIEKSGIVFHGRLSDVRPAMAACSVYVLPSRYREGLPRSILEAMATGRAIITSDTPGCRDTIHDGRNGIIVRPGDAEALFDAMVRFVREPELAARMGEESRRIAEAKYDVELVNAEMLRISEL